MTETADRSAADALFALAQAIGLALVVLAAAVAFAFAAVAAATVLILIAILAGILHLIGSDTRHAPSGWVVEATRQP
jgi:hypothetical protein